MDIQINNRMGKWNRFVEFVSSYISPKPARLSDRLERKPRSKSTWSDGNHRSRVQAYPGGPTLSLFMEAYKRANA